MPQRVDCEMCGAHKVSSSPPRIAPKVPRPQVEASETLKVPIHFSLLTLFDPLRQLPLQEDEEDPEWSDYAVRRDGGGGIDEVLMQTDAAHPPPRVQVPKGTPVVNEDAFAVNFDTLVGFGVSHA